MKTLKALLVAATVGTGAFVCAQTGDKPAESKAATREITIVNIEYQGAKVWIPSTLIVKKGEKIKLTLVNNTPSGKHGFEIDEFSVKVEVDKDKKLVEFTADKAGLFRTYCQLHPGHVTGELLVLE